MLENQIFHSISAQGIGFSAHIGLFAPLCDKNLRTKTVKKATARCAKTPIIANLS